MKHQIGLKLYANNISLINICVQKHAAGVFDFIELYIIPGDFEEYCKIWKRLNLPFVIHAAHCLHGVNLSKKSFAAANLVAYEEAKRYANLLNSPIIIFHPGLAGDVCETAKQLNAFNDKRIVVENKPFISLNGKRCVGGSAHDIKTILRSCDVGFCLDVTHAVKYAYSNDIDYIDYLRELINLKPRIVHISDGDAQDCFDKHLNLGKGNFNLNGIFDILDETNDRYMITLESPKDLSSKLDDFDKEARYLKETIINKGGKE